MKCSCLAVLSCRTSGKGGPPSTTIHRKDSGGDYNRKMIKYAHERLPEYMLPE